MKIKNYLGKLLGNALIRLALAIAIIAIIGLSTVGHYGVSTDEKIEILMVRWNYQLIKSNTPIPITSRYYGPAFNTAAEIAFQTNQFFKKGFSHNPFDDLGGKIHDEWIRERIIFKQPFSFTFSLITYISLAGIISIVCGVRNAWIAPLILPLFPRYWGHSFFDPKDIPFAACFTLCTYLGSHVVHEYIQTDKKFLLGVNRITILSMVYGIVIGLLTGIRIAGFLFLFFILVTHFALIIRNKDFYKNLKNVSVFYLLMFVFWAGTTTLVHPASWSNPIGWFFDAIEFMSNFWAGNSSVLFEGQLINTSELPWYYIPKWIVITTPIIFQIGFITGLIWLFYKYKKFSNLQKSCVILVLLQVFFIPILVLLKESSNGSLRHFFFTIPGIAAISIMSFIWTYKAINWKPIKIAFVTILLTSFTGILLDIISLHPYEYIYFNRISGGVMNAHTQYGTDHFGLSLRDAMEWINKNGKSDDIVLLPTLADRAAIFSKPSLTVVSKSKFEKLKLEKPNYYVYLAIHRWQYEEEFPECPIVYQVMKHQVPLSIVKECKSE